MAPGPDSGLYVSIPERSAWVLALLDGTGRPRSGWPIKLTGATDCALPSVAQDGSVRLVCSVGVDTRQRAYAFDTHGRQLAGWPVDLDDSTGRLDQRAIGDQLFVVAHRQLDDIDPATESALGEAWLVTVADDGVIRAGVRVRDEVGGVPAAWRLGLDGTVYGTTGENRWLTAFDSHGLRLGWPVMIEGFESSVGGSVSNPAFGPQGRIYLTVVPVEPSTSAVFTTILDSDGRTVTRTELPLTGEDLDGWSLVDDPPIVAADGTVFLVGASVYRLDAAAQLIDGWPFPGVEITRPGYCPPEEPHGCDFPPVAPIVGPGDVLHLLRSPSEPDRGGSVMAIGPNGQVRAGWPVTLRGAGSEFWSIAVGPDGTAYALAVEPEDAVRYSATILAIAPDGTVRYNTTIVEP